MPAVSSLTSPPRLQERFGSYLEAVEAFFDEPWSDGLPVVPPTPELVERMVATGGRGMDECLGSVPERELSVYVWQAATCAVMAGCKPEYFPVILATWDAMLEPRFKLHTMLSSTGGAAVAAVVSGPYAEKIGMRSGTGVFGPGNRANATIGRSIRIGAFTVLKAIAGQLDASSFGHAGKYTFHFAEGEPPSPWPNIRAQMGFPADASTVTVMAAEAPRQVMHRWQPSPDDMLNTLAAAMRDPSQNAVGNGTCYLVVLGPEHAGILADGGLTPRDVREALSERSMITVKQLADAGIKHQAQGSRHGPADDRGRVMTVRAPHILVMTAGGPGAGWSAVVPSWSWLDDSHPVTRAIQLPGAVVPQRDMSRADPELDFA